MGSGRIWSMSVSTTGAAGLKMDIDEMRFL
jgi:hypothetical protein